MSSTGTRFDSFLSNIQLNSNQIKDAITKHTGVRKCLHNAYYTSTYKSLTETEQILEQVLYKAYENEFIRSYSSNEVLLDDSYKHKTSLLVGSYGKNTAIAPPSDIDILFELPIDQFTRYDSYTSNGQSKLLQDIKAILKKTYPLTDIRADGQIVFVPFGTYKIEVLPAFKLLDGKYLYPNTHDGGRWEYTNPRAEKQNLRDSNKRSNGNTIRLIKMLKAWKHNCNVPIKSLTLELRSVNFLEKWEHHDKSSFWYDWMMRDFFAALLEYKNGTCQIPGIDDKVNYGDAWESKVYSAWERSKKACEYEMANEYTLATIEWQKIFGNRFPF